MKQVGRERVTVIKGKKPIMFVAPHGPDDYNTAKIVERVEGFNFHAVINNGFERDDEVDVLKDKADCNRVDHVTEDVVYDEFLDPILKFVNLYKKFGKKPIIFYIHGFGNQVELETGEKVSCILGYGEGTVYPSYTCSESIRKSFTYFWRSHVGRQDIFYGKGGSKYAARHVNNMTQYFRKQTVDLEVQSLQIELSPYMRSIPLYTGASLCQIANLILDNPDFNDSVDMRGI